ncbi:MAG: hypothetical protein KAI55_05030, partial [Candidatus Aenigmarchaeota archaeon]|nr:hypothetical protein [Candidatus Aenigmarchaeota archaeon]
YSQLCFGKLKNFFFVSPSYIALPTLLSFMEYINVCKEIMQIFPSNFLATQKTPPLPIIFKK